MHIETATLAQLQGECLNNDELMAYLGGFDEMAKMSLEKLREKMTDWVIAGDDSGIENAVNG